MTRGTRIIIVPAGLAVPLASNEDGLVTSLFVQALNAVWWALAVTFTYAYRRPLWGLLPAASGFAVAFLGYRALDLSADAQAAIGLLFIPLYAAAASLIGGLLGWGLDAAALNPSLPRDCPKGCPRTSCSCS